jgi:hypothetical protein
MKNVFFGLGLQYEDGSAPSIAMSRDGRVMEVHESIGDGDLAYRLGKRRQMGLLWAKQNVVYGRGLTPSIAFNGHLLMEVHKEIFGDDDLAWRTAVWNDGDEGPSEIRFSDPVKYASGKVPRIAMNDRIAVAVHQSPTGPSLWFNACDIGEDASVRWRGNVGLGPGIQPNIAINQGNVAVIVYRSPSDSNLYYRIGAVREIEVAWGQAIAFGTGSDAAVALSDDGEVIVVFQSSQSRTLLQRFGKIGDNAIHWAGDAVHFDNGQHACVACAGRMAIQAHESENTMTLWASTSRVTNRARWMHHNMDVLGDKTLPRLTTGASHDAGMYQHGALATLGKTQNLNIYQQLRNGIRYFDLRPKWSGNALYVHHGGISGPTVAEIADDVRNFMREGNRELVVLKFSHYEKFTGAAYEALVAMLQEKLRDWLYRQPLQGRRLADIPMREFLAQSGVVLVVCDGDYPIAFPAAGIWVYRDFDAAHPELGDLRVYDKYSNSMIYETMKAGQLRQFQAYNGFCAAPNAEVPCDQFLLSWTLTPPTGVWLVSQEANRNLGEVMATQGVPNPQDLVINYLYVDYEEYSRATDVAMFMNGIE